MPKFSWHYGIASWTGPAAYIMPIVVYMNGCRPYVVWLNFLLPLSWSAFLFTIMTESIFITNYNLHLYTCTTFPCFSSPNIRLSDNDLTTLLFGNLEVENDWTEVESLSVIIGPLFNCWWKFSWNNHIYWKNISVEH